MAENGPIPIAETVTIIPMNPARILFLAANPSSTSHLALDEEVRAIQLRLRTSGAADSVELRCEWALRGSELPAALMRHRPQIVHFSGHGSAAGELIFSAETSQEISVVALETLRRIFEPLSQSISCVVLNACYSLAQASALAELVPCVVGMSGAVNDTVAIAFAAGFYEALAFGESVATAFKLGSAQVELAREMAQREVPKLLLRPGTNGAALRPFAPAVPPAKQDDSTDELIAIFEDRAQVVKNILARKREQLEVAEFLRAFESLHLNHLRALRAHHFLRAHEIVRQIFKLSIDFQASELWAQGKAVAETRPDNLILSYHSDAEADDGVILATYLPEAGLAEQGGAAPEQNSAIKRYVDGARNAHGPYAALGSQPAAEPDDSSTE